MYDAVEEQSELSVITGRIQVEVLVSLKSAGRRAVFTSLKGYD